MLDNEENPFVRFAILTRLYAIRGKVGGVIGIAKYAGMGEDPLEMHTCGVCNGEVFPGDAYY